ncbi:hypothetical protein [Acinetobacter lwoffii]|uniref:hypothetical protein n=1 Tax=Acinetobacter lwoffii TaxID=28090 RepID=UPI0002CE8E89|nr:hypothetical protein [Acinetobacter lwoffii]ENW28470.1 hypothetical protein F924_01510 [Acinetobacter lwoffii ATCC 9957 = CIP 70.31]
MIKTPLSTVIGGAFWTPGATVIGGNTPTLGQQIQKLFANGEQGFFYDPNDLSTMFQDAAGTTPVTVAGQPVGLVLDKSKGRGLEHILTNSNDFTLSSDKWSKGSSVQLSLNPTNGAARVAFSGRYTDANNHFGYGEQRANLREMFEVSFDAKWVSGSNLVVTNGYSSAIGVVTPQENTGITNRYSFKLFNNSGGLNRAIIFSSSSSIQEAIWEVSNVSTTYILGNHSYQNTSASRPILQDVPKRIDFDAVDDKLITNLPAQLTGCTVIRAVPNVGTQILTSQTIPATYEDNKDHCGLIVINRALTPSETSAIAAEFNKRAGV